MITTIIFDIGNVLAGFEWKAYFRKFGYSKEVLARIAKATVESKAWSEYDRGMLTDDEVLDEFVRNDPGIEKELRESLGNIDGMLVKYDYAIPWVKELKQKGYQVLVLSNFAHRAHHDCKDVLGFLDYVDGGILSYQEKTIKPEPEIYQALFQKYQLDPTECVFLDDNRGNIVAANQLGMATILFHTKQQADGELRSLGVNF